MANLTIQKPIVTGVALTHAAATSGGDKVTNNGKVMLEIINGDSGPHTVTVSAQKPCSFGVSDPVHDEAVVVAAGVTKIIGPFNPDQFNDANGQINIAYSAVTSVTIAALSIS